ncbi:hypothetical protein DYB26_014207, partial [Aphanomyces astaci]
MRKFMDQYQAYAHEVNIANAQRPDGAQIQRAPMCTCIDPLSVERIAYWEIGKASHELTEEDWKVFFLGAKDSDPVDISKLDVAMAKLKMDTTVQSAESRGLGFRGGTRAPVNGGELMKLNENRSHKKDARVCKRWLADYMRRYGEIEPLMADKLPAATNPRLGRPPIDVAEVSLDNAVMCAARVVCVAGQAVSLDASFDSGADQSVVPHATLAKLKKQGRNVLVTKLKTPIK